MILYVQDGAFKWGVINSCWIFQIAGFAPTRLIIFVFRLVIDQYFQSGILFISAGQSEDGRQGWLDEWGRTQQSEKLWNSYVKNESLHLRFGVQLIIL